MLRIVILPAMLLVLGVTDASAETCKVIQRWAPLRDDSSVPEFPKYNSPDANKLCELHEGVEFEIVDRKVDGSGQTWVRGKVLKEKDGNGKCRTGFGGGYDSDKVEGYVAQYVYSGVAVLSCH